MKKFIIASYTRRPKSSLKRVEKLRRKTNESTGENKDFLTIKIKDKGNSKLENENTNQRSQFRDKIIKQFISYHVFKKL